jgi:hypothetical protein
MSDGISRDVPQMLMLIMRRFCAKRSFYSPTVYLDSIKRKSLFRLNVIGDRKNVVKVVALKKSTYNTSR